MAENCDFCDSRQMAGRIIYDCNHWFVVRCNFPVSNGHTLIILKRHHPGIFDITLEEWIELQLVLDITKKSIERQFDADGYNVGANCGEAAGQTVFHCHVHLIPRYVGDVEDPRGGIRNIKKPVVPYA